MKTDYLVEISRPCCEIIDWIRQFLQFFFTKVQKWAISPCTNLTKFVHDVSAFNTLLSCQSAFWYSNTFWNGSVTMKFFFRKKRQFCDFNWLPSQRPLSNCQIYAGFIKPLGPFTLEIYFEILLRNKNFEIFSFECKQFHIGNKLSKANIDDASFDVCKHWPTNQSQCSISEISSAKFRKIEHVMNCEMKFGNLFFRKLTVHTRNFLVKGTNLQKFRN